jgi:hypothetical protein
LDCGITHLGGKGDDANGDLLEEARNLFLESIAQQDQLDIVVGGEGHLVQKIPMEMDTILSNGWMDRGLSTKIAEKSTDFRGGVRRGKYEYIWRKFAPQSAV